MKIFFDVDTQKDFMNKDGALYVPGAEDIKSNLSKLTQHALNNAIPLFGTLDYHTPDDPEFKIFPPHCVQGTEGAKRIKETAVGVPLLFQKATIDVFHIGDGNRHIRGALKGVVTEAVVYGVATDYCVKAAVLGLLKLGIKVQVVEDAIAGVDLNKGDVANAIKEMKEAGAIFIKTEEIVNE